MKGSLVTAKIAGMESTAKIKSVNSTSSSTTNSGVAIKMPSLRMKNFSPWNSGVTGMKRLKSFTSGLFSGWISVSRFTIILMPVAIRKTPKT